MPTSVEHTPTTRPRRIRRIRLFSHQNRIRLDAEASPRQHPGDQRQTRSGDVRPDDVEHGDAGAWSNVYDDTRAASTRRCSATSCSSLRLVLRAARRRRRWRRPGLLPRADGASGFTAARHSTTSSCAKPVVAVTRASTETGGGQRCDRPCGTTAIFSSRLCGKRAVAEAQLVENGRLESAEKRKCRNGKPRPGLEAIGRPRRDRQARRRPRGFRGRRTSAAEL